MRERHERGVILVVVLFFALLLSSSVATFVRRATLDAMISRNRDAAARAAALARGGARLATALVVEAKLRKAAQELPIDTTGALWAIAGDQQIDTGDGSTLTLRINDTSSRLNLNALFDPEEGGVRDDLTVLFLRALLDNVIEKMHAAPAEKELYKTDELTNDLIDWVDRDDVRQSGGSEDDYYRGQDPPYEAANRPLMSVDELRLIKGFDTPLVAALADYVTVYPFIGQSGVNPNTSPAHVLSLLYANDGVNNELAQADTVRAILDVRENDGIICPDEINHESCTPIREFVPNEIFPPPGYDSNAFHVRAIAAVGEVQRTVEAVVDLTQPDEPLWLSFRLR
ncbi:MAG: type II secretion system minor pseudopilin GspK [Myxococcales bacterium]|nr:type II secretion system minor pseudopilin GspK [Myxococcales bacterium]